MSWEIQQWVSEESAILFTGPKKSTSLSITRFGSIVLCSIEFPSLSDTETDAPHNTSYRII